MSDQLSLAQGLGLSEGRTRELRDLVLRVLKGTKSISHAVIALVGNIDDPLELAYASTELGHIILPEIHVKVMNMQAPQDPLDQYMVRTTAEA
jgi:hypothetical protein